MKSQTLLFIVINYFNETEVSNFVVTHFGSTYCDDVEIVIVNNGCHQISILDALAQKYSFVKILGTQKNLGYFGAANFGLMHYLKSNELPDATIVCNTDISFDKESFFKSLKNILSTKEFDVLGPEIYSTFLKYHQNPYITKRLSRGMMMRYKFFTSSVFLYSLFTTLHLAKTKILRSNMQNRVNEPMYTYAVHGSFMVFNKTYFTKGGTLQYPSFLFGEEIFVAETALKLNMKILYHPALVVNHFQNTTTGTFKSPQTVKFMHQSYCHLLNTYFQ